MPTPITIKMPDELLFKIENTCKASSISRHATILILLKRGLVTKKLASLLEEEKVSQKDNAKGARREGIFAGVCYTIAALAALIVLSIIFVELR